jgi:hypothetical protein
MNICVSNLNDGKPSFGRNSSATEQYEGITQGIEQCMTLMTTTKVQEPCKLEPHNWDICAGGSTLFCRFYGGT